MQVYIKKYFKISFNLREKSFYTICSILRTMHIIASFFYLKNTKYIIIHITPYVLLTFYTSEAYSLLVWLIKIFLIFLHYFKLSFFKNCFKLFSTLKYPKHYLFFQVHILEKKLKILDSTLLNSPITSTTWLSFIHL